jgi:opacity protein-like surface antigen
MSRFEVTPSGSRGPSGRRSCRPIRADRRARRDHPFARAWTVVLAVVLAGAFVASAGAAPVDPEVQRHFGAGNDLYLEGKYADALVEYDAAYELSRNWKILYNRGQCLVMLRREPEAIDAFERYLASGGDEIPPARRREVEADLPKLRARLGTILVQGAPAGSTIFVDGRVAGRTPLAAPIPAGAGNHELVVQPPSGAAATATVRVIAGSQTVHRIESGADDGDPATPPAPAPDPRFAAPRFDERPVPPPEPVLPPRRPGGLLAPSLLFGLQLHTSIPVSRDYAYGQQRALGGGELSASLRPNGFWEVGLFVFGAAGAVAIDDAVRVRAGPNSPSPTAEVDANAAYSHGGIGARLRLHLLRTRVLDGWVGFDVGAWQERWRFEGPQAFEYTASSSSYALGLGVDVPLSSRWALGLSTRFLSAGASNGRRTNCTGDLPCDGRYLPGEGDLAPSGGLSSPKSTTRGFVEVGLRLVWLIPLGDAEAASAPKPATARVDLPRFDRF